ncbi:MAG TPA: carboxylating nicotinate-nucleotide diphosphorylase [Saprospiraceae bacterium]|nr:carboxylating nicotinate-nucleotide diphosphorylase [Saprospiraceae bacterium]MCB9272025.1 carboxylating nicotinate-nucleotide diphosphorylase [Lewinellaceae bacterium]HPG09196.1 carboxylating nicotinate-nucleotide diphosphorylase [Saprospiraceae bacterium]HPQ98578.1 carboxylating nicotinate-nucleotide diphosphorylase [Saprospiraceae bacterium]HQU52694.1 carboxylating nicotinate-nucleotide diphosphorylase [Saprospiraceae bacterium]
MEGISSDWINWFIDTALKEDVGSGDHTSLACIDKNARSKASLLVKDVGVLAGVDLAAKIMDRVDPDHTFTKLLEDGTDVNIGDVAFTIEAKAQSLLKAERLILNTMQRMSGIATMSERFAAEVEGLPVIILDTRKTTPLLRPLEKWAVRIGGCSNYRDGLYDWIMIKDNHITACGSISSAIDKVHAYLKANKLDLGITIEVKNLLELYEVLQHGGVTRIMLDNFELPILREAVAIVDHRFETEASGGVNLHTVRRIAETGVDYVSVGALTHSAGVLDLSLKILE